MPLNLTQGLIRSRLAGGSMKPGDEIAIHIDQVLLQDVLGTLVILELEAMGANRVKVGVAAQLAIQEIVRNEKFNNGMW